MAWLFQKEDRHILLYDLVPLNPQASVKDEVDAIADITTAASVHYKVFRLCDLAGKRFENTGARPAR